jgi:hypothetical protein
VERTVYRTFSASANTWRESRLLQANQMALLDSVCYAPVVFQEYIPAHVELRVLVVGDTLFATAQPASDDAKASASEIAPMELHPLPAQLETQIRTLMARLDLAYSVIHMRITLEGRHVFMGLDPIGSWLDVEERIDLPISAAIAQMLHDKDRTTISYGLSRFRQRI